MNVRQATRSYEAWMRGQIPVNERDLRLKHGRMAESPFLFLRATFYRWIQRWPEVCPSLTTAPRVMAVGDLHVENFGTWRDAEGRLVWGVNDVDEACELPYTQDLVRLATSAVLATGAGHFALPLRGACEAVLDGYLTSLEQGDGRSCSPSAAAGSGLSPSTICAIPPYSGRSYRVVAPRDTVRRSACCAASSRRARRCAAPSSVWPAPEASDDRASSHWRTGAGLVAREAKAILPSAGTWADPECSRVNAASLLARAVRVADPFFDLADGWILRRLAPDCCRIELIEMPRRRDEARLLRAMGWETANLHLASRNRGVERDLRQRPKRWLARAAGDMADATIDDFRKMTDPLRQRREAQKP